MGVVIIQHTNVNVSLYVGYRDNYVYIVLQINFELVRRHPQQIGGSLSGVIKAYALGKTDSDDTNTRP